MAVQKKKATRKKSAKVAKEEAQNEADMQSISEGADNAVPYTMGSAFQEKMVLKHPKFGLGLVTAVFPEKIEVKFKDGVRWLVHQRKN